MRSLGLASYFEYSQKRTDIFCYFYYEIVHRHIQGRPSSQCHRAMALVVFLPRPEIWGIFWVPGNKKSQSPEVALVDFRPDGRPCSYLTFLDLQENINSIPKLT